MENSTFFHSNFEIANLRTLVTVNSYNFTKDMCKTNFAD